MCAYLTERSVDLGFAEECDPELLTSQNFPSKIGGKPAWLELQNLPTLDEVKCTNCAEPLIFLCQVCYYILFVNCVCQCA